MARASVNRWVGLLGRYVLVAPARTPRAMHVPAYRLRNVGLQEWPVTRVADVPGVGVITCDTADFIQRYLYLFGVWEPAISTLMRDHLKPGDVFVDVGANIGYYSLLAARAVGKDGSVIAFEPSPAVGRQLAANIERNGLGDRVTVHSVAAGAVPGTANIFLAGRDNIGQTSTRPGPGFTAEGEVDVRRVDDCVPVTAYPKVTFLKIDTEGDELAAAEGARALMSAMPRGAMVLVEVDEPRMAQRDTTPRALFDLMTAHGFRAFSIKNDYDVASYVRRDPAPLDPVTGVVARGDVVFVKDE